MSNYKAAHFVMAKMREMNLWAEKNELVFHPKEEFLYTRFESVFNRAMKCPCDSNRTCPCELGVSEAKDKGACKCTVFLTDKYWKDLGKDVPSNLVNRVPQTVLEKLFKKFLDWPDFTIEDYHDEMWLVTMHMFKLDVALKNATETCSLPSVLKGKKYPLPDGIYEYLFDTGIYHVPDTYDKFICVPEHVTCLESQYWRKDKTVVSIDNIYCISLGYNKSEIESYCWGGKCGKGGIGAIIMLGGSFIPCTVNPDNCPIVEQEQNMGKGVIEGNEVNIIVRKLKKVEK